MLRALASGQLVTAVNGVQAACPACGGPVRARHSDELGPWWSHVAGDCDPWAEPNTPWHLEWKRAFPDAQVETVVGGHRADIVTTAGWVIELQRKSISVGEITAREKHYGQRMLWVFDAAGHDDGRLHVGDADGPGDESAFRWPGGRRALTACRRPAFLDVGDGYLLRLLEMRDSSPPRGKVRVGSRAALTQWAAGTAAAS